jgi:DNA-binding beta-propeller fold protein YncE
VKTGKLLLTSGALATILAITLSGTVMANGVGDLYVATSSGVLEVQVKAPKVVSTIPMVPASQSLAFSPDGRSLYVARNDSQVTPIDIASLDVMTPINMPGNVTGLAFPAGEILVGTMPTRRSLAFAVVNGGVVTESAQLPGAGNIIAADRRDARVAVAEAGKSWLDIVDPATATLKKTTVAGGIVALAVDRNTGGVLVATQDPNALLRVDMTSLVTTWTVKLPAAPTAVAALASTAVVSGGTSLWQVDGKTASKLATASQAAVALSASDEGAFVHVAEASAIEVFDAKGKLQRTLKLTDAQSPVAMAAIPAGSSLFLGDGPAGSTASAGTETGALTTVKPATTSTVVDGAADVVGSPPFQGALAVAVGILLICWLAIRWYDRRAQRLR